ncbi:hypothetical protein UUU_42530 [Klebsiella pneumoniae subsp. pneumoniae DSM 30104 = JCM 1662 = NBRC 14940]|nr:hypothetical protein UUU_42530 [Klebsiella pneumoniae subsp. pneumoniae DSM 30104 = JCM 1662 = NBRC 14940]
MREHNKLPCCNGCFSLKNNHTLGLTQTRIRYERTAAI